MKPLIILSLLPLSSCSWNYIKTSDIEAWRVSFATDAQFDHISYSPDSHALEINGIKSSQTKGTEAAVKGAVEGIISGALPIPLKLPFKP